MFRIFIQLLLGVFVLNPLARADTWVIDKAHSSIGFNVRHMVLAKVYGGFADYEGQIEFDGSDVQSGAVNFTVQMGSVDTDNQKRDDHLRSSDFFEVETYPTMSFKSKKIIKGEGSDFKIVGDLTIKDVTREVTFDAELIGVITDPYGNTRAGFAAHTEINRQDFNVKWSKTLDTGGLIAGNDVYINIDMEIVKPN